MSSTISHALVLPDADFRSWYDAAAPYARHFERVTIVRSPRGNDLNRYYSVSAVQAPGVWVNDDAYAHVRRAYPSVVRVDVIRASTPAQLAQILNDRVARNDRYAEYLKDGHLTDRFTLLWPCDGRPASIVRRFDTDQGNGLKLEGADLNAPAGSLLRAPVGGVISAIRTNAAYGTYIQIGTQFYPTPGMGQPQYWTITLTQIQAPKVQEGQAVKAGDALAQAVGPTTRLIVQLVGGGQSSGYVVPNVVNPSPLIYWDGLRLRPTADGLRLREKPGTEFTPIGQVYTGDLLEPLEPHGRTLEKLGVEGAWVKVRTPLNLVGYTAGWLLTATTREQTTGFNLTGMNLDLLHLLGRPAPGRLNGIGWVRLPYKATPSQGFASIEAAHMFYEPRLKAYADAGYRVIVILTHQTYGEGGGFNWDSMYRDDRARWNDYIPRFVEAVRSVARRYAGKNIVSAYQIWNEQDTPFGHGLAAVPMQAEDYARLLTESVRAIRSIDPSVKIITGGHITGPTNGSAYARETLARMPAELHPDGIACHSYGRGAPDSSPRYTSFGPIGDDINTYEALLPGKPVWITEWGVLDMPDDAPEAISDYAVSFLRHVKASYRRKVVCACWYAFADTMHNGYGLVDRNDRPKYPLYDNYLIT